MTLKYLRDTLQAEIDKVDWTKIKTHADFHFTMRSIFRCPLKVADCLDIRLWNIVHDDNHEEEVFVYTRKFVAYKNCTHADKGHFSEVSVSIAKDLDPEMVVSDLPSYFRKKQLLKKFDYLSDRNTNISVELVQNTEKLRKIQEELMS